MNKVIYYRILTSKNPVNELSYFTKKFNVTHSFEDEHSFRKQWINAVSSLKEGDKIIIRSLRDIFVFDEITTCFLLKIRDLKANVISLVENFNSEVDGWDKTIENAYNLFGNQLRVKEIYSDLVNKIKWSRSSGIGAISSKYSLPIAYMNYLPSQMPAKIEKTNVLSVKKVPIKKQKTSSKWLEFFKIRA